MNENLSKAKEKRLYIVLFRTYKNDNILTKKKILKCPV